MRVEAMTRPFMQAICILSATVFMASGAAAQSPEARKQFFQGVKAAEFFDGKRFNCCGPGDATRARILASHGGMLAVEITDPMRHPTARKGDVVTVPRRLIVKHPMAPEGMGTILFLSIDSKEEHRRPYCLVQQRAGG